MPSVPIILLLFSFYLLQALGCQKGRAFQYNERQAQAIFFGSSEAPMTNVLARDRDVVEGTRVIQEYLSYIEEQVVEGVSRRMSTEQVEVPVCEATESVEAWRKATCALFGIRSWPNPASGCISDISDVHVRNQNPIYNVDQLWHAFNRRAEGNRRSVKEIAARAAPNFTKPTDIKSFITYDEHQDVRCTMHAAVGFRLKIGDTFRIAFNVQNLPHDEFHPVGKRHALIEYASVDNGKLGNNYRMRLPVFELADNETRIWRTNATTMFRGVRFGPLKASALAVTELKDNPSIVEALSKADIFLQQVANTLLPSTIAILFFPLLLNFVPISFFSYVSTVQMLLYTLMSDVLTVLPLAIKGIELISIQNMKYRAVVVRMGSEYDLFGRAPEAVPSESWAAQCEAKGNLGRVGASFLGIALSALVMGLLLEYFSYSYVKRKRRKGLLISIQASSI